MEHRTLQIVFTSDNGCLPGSQSRTQAAQRMRCCLRANPEKQLAIKVRGQGSSKIYCCWNKRGGLCPFNLVLRLEGGEGVGVTGCDIYL